ncbi:hypothetical protein [Gimesia aquarii]|uniref:Uncharacterized protein n=1 Tax=Gimesia aquarii TaxID=2527964 RepID=A0A517VUZ6_9PLAN|nr:hypothetical protein [Gimesia aquarii]QDT96824.1 hypothetical protein V144x_22820 [Gimesia aquarii]
MKGNEPTTSEITENDEGFRVFRPKKSDRNDYLLSLVIFTLMGIGFTYSMWLVAHPAQKINAVIAFTLLCSIMPGMMLWGTLICQFSSTTIQNETVLVKGVFSQKEINLSNVIQARWRLTSHGALTLKTLIETGTINLMYLEKEERLWLIQYFQSHLPESVQQNWDLFCLRIAIPLRDPKPKAIRDPGPSEILLTRRRWDWLCLPFIFLFTIGGIIAAWIFLSPRHLLIPIPTIIIWLLMRYSTDKKGEPTQRISADKEFVKLWKFITWWSCICLIIFIILELLNPPGLFGEFPGFIVMALWTPVIYWRLYRSYRIDHLKDLEKAKQAVQQWETGPESVQNIET